MRFPDIGIGFSRVIDLIVLVKIIHRPALLDVYTYAD
jgi:hypothetical protein